MSVFFFFAVREVLFVKKTKCEIASVYAVRARTGSAEDRADHQNLEETPNKPENEVDIPPTPTSPRRVRRSTTPNKLEIEMDSPRTPTPPRRPTGSPRRVRRSTTPPDTRRSSSAESATGVQRERKLPRYEEDDQNRRRRSKSPSPGRNRQHASARHGTSKRHVVMTHSTSFNARSHIDARARSTDTPDRLSIDRADRKSTNPGKPKHSVKKNARSQNATPPHRMRIIDEDL